MAHQKKSKILNQLSALILHFTPPTPYDQLVLHYPDLALHSLLWNPEDPTKIAGVIDWGGSQIIPLILSAYFLGDIMITMVDPLERPVHPDQCWAAVPHDWRSIGNTSKWPNAYKRNHELVNEKIRAS